MKCLAVCIWWLWGCIMMQHQMSMMPISGHLSRRGRAAVELLWHSWGLEGAQGAALNWAGSASEAQKEEGWRRSHCCLQLLRVWEQSRQSWTWCLAAGWELVGTAGPVEILISYVEELFHPEWLNTGTEKCWDFHLHP